MNRLVRILKSKPLIIGVSAVVIYTLSGFFLTPYLVRHYVPKILRENLNTHATIGKVRFNPYVFVFEANDFRMDEKDGRLIGGFKKLLVDFELKSLFKWAWTFKQVSVEEPHVNTVIDKAGHLNLTLIVPASDTKPPEKKDESLPRLIFEQIVIDRGRIDFTDQRQTVPATVYLMPLNLNIENLTTLPEQEGSKFITATTGDGEIIRWTGNIGLNPLITKGTFSFENIMVSTLWKFARDSVNLDAPSGKLTVSADYEFEAGSAEPMLILDNLSVGITGVILKITGAETPFLELPKALVTGSGFDIFKQQGEIQKVSISGGKARVGVDENGVLNLVGIVNATGSEPQTDPKISPAKDAGITPWKIKLSDLNLDGFSIDYQDASRSPGLKAGIDKIKVGLNGEAEIGGGQDKISIHDISADLSGIVAKLADSPEPEVRLNNIMLTGGAYDLGTNHFTTEKIAVNGGKVDLKRQADGDINLVLLGAPPDKGLVAEEIEESESVGHPFHFLAKTIAVSGLETAVSDLSVSPDGTILNLEEISVILNNVDGKTPMTFNLGMKIHEGGQVKAEGTIDPAVPSVESEIVVSDFGLTPFQPYIDQEVSLVLKSGTVSTQGTLRYGIKEAGSQTAFNGGLKLENFQLIEPGGAETFLGWKTLQTDQLKLLIEPSRLEIGELKVAQLAGKFIIYEDNTLNITRVIKTDSDSNSESAPDIKSGAADSETDPFPVLVRRLVLSDGKMEFADLSMTPQFGTRIHELRGVVAGISTKQDARAQVKLDGRVDEYGTAKIDGELNTSDPKAFTNISMIFRNLEMTKLTPYSGRFAGRKIDSGKLSVDLKYDIQQSRLSGENQIVVERLVLGKRIQSPDAVNLPLDLAIALLEDRNGVIDIGLPVRGNLDTPEFSYGALIWKALTNLITRIATSPFRALGALLPGGREETLNIVAFEPGKPAIPPPEKEKLANLASALQKRPKLKLTVQGRYNPETDLAELRSASLRRSVAIRQGQQLAPDEDPGPVDYGSPNTAKILEAMFLEKFGSEELDAVKEELKATEDNAGKETGDHREAKDPGRLAKMLFYRLVDTEPVGQSELVRLADARSGAIMQELLGPGGFPADRVEIKPSASLAKREPPTALLGLEVVK